MNILGKMSLNTPLTLLQKLKKHHDEHSWERFVQYYRNYLFAVVRNMLFNDEDSEDLVQDILVKAWRKLPDFDYDPGKGKFRWWLCTMTRNTTLNFIDKRRRDVLRLQEGEQQKLELYLDQVKLPEIEKITEQEWKNYISNLAWENIEKSLIPKAREAFKLSLEGKSVPEIARFLEVSDNNVSLYKNRVKNKLCREILRLDFELS